MPKSQVVKHQVVLPVRMIRPKDSQHIGFTRGTDEPGEVPPIFYLPVEAWEDLGQPSTITVTVEFGDKLNDS